MVTWPGKLSCIVRSEAQWCPECQEGSGGGRWMIHCKQAPHYNCFLLLNSFCCSLKEFGVSIVHVLCVIQFSKLLITLTFSQKNIQSPVCFDPEQLADLSIFLSAVFSQFSHACQKPSQLNIRQRQRELKITNILSSKYLKVKIG